MKNLLVALASLLFLAAQPSFPPSPPGDPTFAAIRAFIERVAK
jgi:hypothetical protein